MSFRRTWTALLVSAATIMAFALGAQGAAAATYDLQGAYVPAGGCDPFSDVCDTTYDYDGTATCRSNCRDAPQTGLFKLTLQGGPRSYPRSACVSQRVDGVLEFYPVDPVFPVDPLIVRVFGNSVDGRGYNVRSYPTDPLRRTISSFVSYPVDPLRPGRHYTPCTAGPFTGSIHLPPNPILEG